jgi:energy-coupling factor transport system substrate-specific component
MSWQAASLAILGLVIGGGFVWFERSRPPARIVAAVAAMAALGVAGRLAFAPIPNVVATTDVALLAGYTLGGGPGFAVGALSGLVSNFWLGQGPWTPWQMAGWGAVGIGGAVLAALSRRRLGRLQLAIAAAVAGLLYGALLDLSVMVSFGGEQSLDRYLALSARGVPFNIAHATGNFVLMITAGPALVRMLDRYRDRFEFRWSDAPLGRAAAAIAVAACLATPLLAPGHSAAAGDPADATTWLKGAMNDDGGFGTEPGASSSVGMTGWAMLGLEAAGTNPRDVGRAATTPVEYLRDHVGEITSVSDLERTILALEGAGLDSRSFEGRDLVAELRDAESGDGSFGHQINLTAFSILAQRSAGVEGANVTNPADWLLAAQNRNGGWGSVEGADSEPDSTGAVLQALGVAPGGGNQADDGVHWLERSQHGDGGWSLTEGASPNAQSTAWAVQGLVAAGRSPGSVKENGRSGIDFISARQGSDGHYSYSSTSDQTPIWVTAQGLTGTRRVAFPLAAVKREKPDKPVDTTTGGTSSGDPGYTPPASLGDLGSIDTNPGIYDSGSSYDPGSFGSSGTGSDATGTGSTESEAPTDPLSATGSDRQRIAANAGTDEFVQSSAPTTLVAQSSPLPDTLVFLAGLGALAAALGGGFLWFRRRLP